MRAASHRSTAVGALLLAASLSAVVLTGCAASPRPLPSASSTPAPTPVFASDEEALAAAEKAYAAYVDVQNDVWSDGGEGFDRYESVASRSALETAIADAQEIMNAGVRTEGENTFVVDAMQSVDYSSDEVEIVLYVCNDASAVRAIDEDGVEVGNPDGAEITPWQIAVSGPSTLLKISERTFWTGDNFCE
ncbi:MULTISPECIES: hypothetical protein [unclassified Leifsonia]|uniref:hypothetical protein n=1 Tax=unclassified Leifsonia TaxID=2663824 RepID=UPI0012F7F581|nr:MULTISPECIES: hypothetical protein [unclassified Leifsonia]